MRSRLLLQWVGVACVLGCTAEFSPAPPREASAPGVLPGDAGWALTADALDRWLRLTEAERGPDAGKRRRTPLAAREDALRLKAAGLTTSERERIEAAVADVMVERSILALSTTRRAQDLDRAMAGLTPQQRSRLEAALGPGRDAGGADWAALEARHGPRTVEVILAREQDVARAWDTLLASD